jgi:DNA-binding transcriptional ArsR family regulator
MTDIFVAISDPKRREILEVLAKDEQTIAQLAKAIKETPAATTKQVAVLKDAGLVKASRAKVAVYSTNPKALKPLGVWVAKFAGAEITAELGERADELAEIASEYINKGSTWLGKKLNPKSKVKNVDDLAKELGRKLATVKKDTETEVTVKVQAAVKEVKARVKRN